MVNLQTVTPAHLNSFCHNSFNPYRTEANFESSSYPPNPTLSVYVLFKILVIDSLSTMLHLAPFHTQWRISSRAEAFQVKVIFWRINERYILVIHHWKGAFIRMLVAMWLVSTQYTFTATQG